MPKLPTARGRRLKLWRQKERIEALLPLVESERAERMRRQLARIHVELGEPIPDKHYPEDYYWSAAAKAGIEGVGGLRFNANAPPGVGRLVRVPFYLTTLPAGFATPVVTDAGAAVAVANPTVIVGPLSGAPAERAVGPIILQTRPLEWAKMRIVGFQTVQRAAPGSVGAIVNSGWPRPQLLVKDLSIGGGASLFPQIDYVDATIYSVRVPELAGLRGNPILDSPNTAAVTAAVLGRPPPAPPSVGPSLTFSCALVCEILEDTGFGAHIPGPYARRDALARKPSDLGTNYLVGEGDDGDHWVELPGPPFALE